MVSKLPIFLLTGMAFYWDLRYRQLPNWLFFISLPAIALQWRAGGLEGIMWGFLLIAVTHLPAYLNGWLGGGDLKMALSLALCLGQIFVRAWLFASLISGLWGGIMLFRRRGRAVFFDLAALFYSGRATSGLGFPYGAALALGTWTALLLG